MTIRRGTQRVCVYNDGFHVYLYDPAHGPDILKANPRSVLETCNVEPLKDKSLKKLAESGMLVVYELIQDDELVVDVVVGPPLTKSELKKSGVKWIKPSQALLHNTSGRLRIDSSNTFRLTQWAQDHAKAYERKHGKPPSDDNLKAFGLTDTSGEIAIPPGDYVLTLHRVDFDAFDDDQEWSGGCEFITLTPIADLAPPKKIAPILAARSGRPTYDGLRIAGIRDGVFEGRAVGGNVVNLTERHWDELGLRRGQRFQIENEGDTHEALFLGGACPVNRPHVFNLLYPDRLCDLRERYPNLFLGAVAADSVTGLSLLRLHHITLTRVIQAKEQSRVRIVPGDEFVLPEPDSLPRGIEGKCAKGTLEGVVVAAGPHALALGVGKDAIREFHVGRVSELILTIGKWRTRVLYLASDEYDFRPYHIATSVTETRDELESKIPQYMTDGGDAMFRAMIGVRQASRITGLIETFTAGSTFVPKKGLVPNDPGEGKRLREAYVDLWIEGLKRWQAKEAAVATLCPHWDAPRHSILLCRPIHHVEEFKLKAGAGKAFTLEHASEA
ncbi:MAG: hypothetical protein AMXMBFR84_42320 [Candidatus Hydrogenedentota bacterium]